MHLPAFRLNGFACILKSNIFCTWTPLCECGLSFFPAATQETIVHGIRFRVYGLGSRLKLELLNVWVLFSYFETALCSLLLSLQAVLWRALYCSTDVYFAPNLAASRHPQETLLSSIHGGPPGDGGPSSFGDPPGDEGFPYNNGGPHGGRALSGDEVVPSGEVSGGLRGPGGPPVSCEVPRLSWRDPTVPPFLAVTRVLSFNESKAAGHTFVAAADAAADAAVDDAVAAAGLGNEDKEEGEIRSCTQQERAWLLSVSPVIPLRMLALMDFCCDKKEFERRVNEMPFQVLRNIAKHREEGEAFVVFNLWQMHGDDVLLVYVIYIHIT